MRKRKCAGILAGASYAAFCAAIAAAADPMVDVADQQQPASLTAPVATEPTATTRIEDIVVTANRRSESAQRSSLSLEVLRGEVLSRVTRPQDLSTVTTGLQIGSTGPYPQIFIRGIGETARSSRTQGAVPFNVDGVFLPRGIQATNSFYDISRIEVLKGPQGTLYGRNATGGVINIITNQPQIGVNSATINAEAGNYNLYSSDVAINLGVSDKAAFRVAGQVVRRDGYLSDGGQDQKTEAGRLRFLWQPSSTIQLLLNGDVSHIHGKGSGVVILPVQGGDPWRSNTQQPLTYPFTLAAPFTQVNDRFLHTTIWGTSAQFDADLGFAKLTILPAYRHQDQDYLSYNTNFRFVEVLADKQATLEARLANEVGRLKWVVGGFYLHQNSRADSYPTNAGTLAANRVYDKRKAAAAFGAATFSVTKAIRLIGGLRYTDERYSGSYTFGTGAFPLFGYTPDPTTAATVPEVATKKINWKAGAEADLAPNSMVFATASTGFRAGGFDNTPGTPGCSGFKQYSPEQVTAYTIGSKNRFADNSLQLNGELFYWKLKNQQFVGQQPNACGVTFNYTFNAGEATIKGANIDLTWKATRKDTFSVSVEYLDGNYDSLRFTQVGLGAYSPAAQSRCRTTPASAAGQYTIDCTGLPVIRSPRWSGKASYEHSFVLPNEAKLIPSVDVQVASSRWLDLAYGPNGHVPSYVLANAELRYVNRKGNFSLSLWMQNITNDTAYTSGTNITPAAPNGNRYYTATISPPRTFGARTHITF